MDSFSTGASGLLRTVISVLQTPVVVILLILMVITVVVLGSFICEWVTERRTLSQNIPDLIDEIGGASAREISPLVEQSHILKRQKAAIGRVLGQDDMDEVSLEAFADQLLFDEEEHYRKYLRWPQFIMRLGPMFGLLGTLIPLGPGLMALGQGDTHTLSQSLLIAFDTTAAGVVIAAIAFVIYQVRKGWYRLYTQGLESIMEVVLERKKEQANAA